jgi:hypothetical protein
VYRLYRLSWTLLLLLEKLEEREREREREKEKECMLPQLSMTGYHFIIQHTHTHPLGSAIPPNPARYWGFVGLAYQEGKDIVFRFIL